MCAQCALIHRYNLKVICSQHVDSSDLNIIIYFIHNYYTLLNVCLLPRADEHFSVLHHRLCEMTYIHCRQDHFFTTKKKPPNIHFADSPKKKQKINVTHIIFVFFFMDAHIH